VADDEGVPTDDVTDVAPADDEPADAERAAPAETTGDAEPYDEEGSTLSDVLEFIAREIVDEPDAVEVTEEADSRGVVLTLRVAKDDMGKVIGKGGRTARAIRTVVKAAGIRAGVRHTHVEIAD
jgi:predicted RNA-binding protein YlqC (UPF0109 family)